MFITLTPKFFGSVDGFHYLDLSDLDHKIGFRQTGVMCLRNKDKL